MGVCVDEPRKEQAAFHIHNLGILICQALHFLTGSHCRHLFPVNEHICPDTAASANYGSAFNTFFIYITLLFCFSLSI